jgi:hypothetical protein
MKVGEVPFVSLDADRRTVEVRVDPILRRPGEPSVRAEAPKMGLRDSLGVAGELARIGWQVNVYRSEHRVLSAGRGHSALLGHVSANPVELWRVWREL